MTWHFTHDKKETIIALLHDIGTPCFAHCIDYVFEDYLNQESSEKDLTEIINKDEKIQIFLKEDNVTIEDLKDYSHFPILENKSPKLCTDRLDGVFHTAYIWLHTTSLKEIKEMYNNMIVLKNEDNNREIGFKDKKTAEKFVSLVYNYAKELQGNKDKYVMKYISELVKKEEEICNIFNQNFISWKKFNKANNLMKTEKKPNNQFYISFETKRRNTIPLVYTEDGDKRIVEVSNVAKNFYHKLKEYKDTTYAYVEEIKTI